MEINANDNTYLLPETKPRDRYNLVYLIVFFTGIGVLIPWNFFITVKQYFEYKLDDRENTTSSVAKNNMQYMFENYLALASMIPMALINILNLLLRRHITPMRRFTIGISTMFLVFLVTLILTKINTKGKEMMFFVLTMITVVILNVCGGIIQGSSLGIISMMPGRYIKGFMEGQAISGLLAAVANIISIALVSIPDNSAFLYFFIALVFLFITAIGFLRLGKIKYSRSYVHIANQMDKHLDEINEAQFPSTTSLGSRISFSEKYIPIMKIIYLYGMTVLIGFLITLSIFPAISSQIETSSTNSLWKKYFTPVTCFLLFNLADYIGRFLCGYVQFPSQGYPKLLLFCSLIRIVFLPLYFMCNISKRNYFPKILIHDAYPIVLTLLMGLSNGYLITLALIYAPNTVSDRDKEAVGTLMSLFICFGLALGVALSFVCVHII